MLILQFKKISLKCHICTLIRDVIGLTFNAHCTVREALSYVGAFNISLWD